jgi:pyruvate formate lyase activating enzyme
MNAFPIIPVGIGTNRPKRADDFVQVQIRKQCFRIRVQFLQAFRPLCKGRWRIYAETSLAVPRRAVELASQCVDGFIVDIKDSNPHIYRAYTGGDPELAYENLALLKELVGPERITVRVPLIPEFNSKEDQTHSLQILKAMGFTRLDPFSYIIKKA